MHSSSSGMMNQAHWLCEVLKWMRIDWLDLPKLTTLRTDGGWSCTFRNPHHITLESDSHPLWIMYRHDQSQQCVSSWCILVQEWRHNQRRYSLHSSFTTRHRSSSRLFQQATSRASKWRFGSFPYPLSIKQFSPISTLSNSFNLINFTSLTWVKE